METENQLPVLMEKSRGSGLSAREAAAFHLQLALGIPAGIGPLMEGMTPYGIMFRPWREKNCVFVLRLEGNDWMILELRDDLPFPPIPRDSEGVFYSRWNRGNFSMKLTVGSETEYAGELAGDLAGNLRVWRVGLGWKVEGTLTLTMSLTGEAKKWAVKGSDSTVMVNEIPADHGESRSSGEVDQNENENETPLNEHETPLNEHETPLNEHETPSNENETPSNENETPSNENETPSNENETPSNENEPTNNESSPTHNSSSPTHNETPSTWDWIPEFWRIPCETIREFNGNSSGCLCFEFEALSTLADFALTVFDAHSKHGIRLDGFRGVCTHRGEHVLYGDSVQAKDRILVLVNFARDFVREFREGERIGGLLAEDLGKLPWKKPVSIRSFKDRRITAVFGDEMALDESVDWMREVSNEEMIAECMSSYHLVLQCMSERRFPEWFLREAFHETQKWKSGRFRWYESRIPNLWVEVEKTAEHEESAWKVVGTNGGYFWIQPIPSNHFESGREEYSKVWKRGIARDTIPPIDFPNETFEEFEKNVHSNFSLLFSLLPRVDAACRETGEIAWNLPPSFLIDSRGSSEPADTSFSRDCDLMGVLLAVNRRLLRLLAFLAVFPDAQTAEIAQSVGSFSSLTSLLLSSTRFLLSSLRLAALRVPVEPSIDAQRLPESIPVLAINRLAARRDRLLALPPSARFAASISRQFLHWLAAQPAEALRRSYVHHSHGGQRRAFVVSFLGEGGIDNGGLYRELFAATMREFHDVQLFPWLRRTPNFADCAVTAGKEDFIWDEEAGEPWIRALGRAVGTAVLSGIQVNLLLSPALWKIIAGETVDETDLEWIDASLSRFLKQCRNGELETTWSFPSFQGTLRVHRDYPPDSIVEPREIEEFCGWVLREAFAAQKRLCGAFRAGFDEVLCGVLQGILRGSEYRELIAGIGDVDVSELRRMTKFEGFLASDREIAWFWRVLGEMSRAQRVKFLQFATARSRLPVFSHQTPLAVG